MFVRVTTVKHRPGTIDPEGFKRNLVPALAAAPGFRGITLNVNRETDESSTAALWETVEAMNQAELRGRQARARDMDEGRAVLDVDRYEVTDLVMPEAPVRLPAFTRVTAGYASPDRLDDIIGDLRQGVVPALKAQPGFLGLLAAVNRTTGRAFTSSSWDSPEHREASNAAIAALRDRVAAQEMYGVEVSLVETAVAELKEAAAG